MLSFFDLRGRRYRREQAAVESARSQSDTAAAAAMVRSHIQRWTFNWHSGGRTANLRDLAHLDWMAGQLEEVSPAHAARAGALRSVVGDLTAFFEDRSNFGIDGRMMKPAAAVRLASLQDALRAARERAAGDPDHP